MTLSNSGSSPLNEEDLTPNGRMFQCCLNQGASENASGDSDDPLSDSGVTRICRSSLTPNIERMESEENPNLVFDDVYTRTSTLFLKPRPAPSPPMPIARKC